jgi:hypothetical protein
VRLSTEQQKLADALMPHVAYVSPGTRFMVEQLIDRYWQPKPIDGPLEVSGLTRIVESHTLKPG